MTTHSYEYAQGTAGQRATIKVPFVGPDDLASDVFARLRGGTFDATDLIVVVDSTKRYLGVVELRVLRQAMSDAPMCSLVDAAWPTVDAHVDQEHVSEIAAAHRVAALPVVAADGTLVGCIKPQTLLDILSMEHQEDVHRTAGILKRTESDRHALEDPPLRRVRLRLPWLIIGLALSTAATALMAGFEAALQANVSIAFYIPALVYLTDAIGTQTEAIAVRGLSVGHHRLAGILLNELVTGGLIGLTVGAIASAGVLAVYGDAAMALGIGISLSVAGSLASMLGLLLPWGLSRIGIDPAFGSGPIATIIQDVLTILTYFLVMTALLPA
ncbi:MAG: magnesium transporter [Hyphomicrobiaceae bacterium]